MTDIHALLNLKTELLCKGVQLDPRLDDHYKTQGIEIYGRKGGAGPLGGRYFFIEDTQTVVNVALWRDQKNTNLVLKEKKGDLFEVYDQGQKGHFCNLKLIPYPQFYQLSTSEGIPMKKIALVHGVDCLASTIYQRCKYWACNQACIFCGIELSLEHGTTIEQKTPAQMNEVINAAKKEKKCRHMTLTIGTPETEDKGVEMYVEMIKGIKQQYPDLPIHVQIEPVKKLAYINQLKEAGADTIGIHIEVVDSVMRMIVTPGKSDIPFELFEANWKHSLEVFGKNQVDTFLLTGFGESRFDFLDDIEQIIRMGVIPYITPVRPIPDLKGKEMPIMNQNALLEIYTGAAQMMKTYGVNPFENKAGCVRCGGCSALNEAYRLLM